MIGNVNGYKMAAFDNMMRPTRYGLQLTGFYFLKLFFLFQYREERFRGTSESTNQRVLWWSIVQTLILILTGIWQMRHLKSFFEAKKLV